MWNRIAKSTIEYCKKGDILGIKGRVQTIYEQDKKKFKNIKIVAEKVTFLSSKVKDE